MLNRTTFFAYVRRAPFGGSLSTAQVEGMTAILDEWDRRRLTDGRWLAYMLATAFHETGAAMQPVRENMNYTTAAQIQRTWPKRFPIMGDALPYVKNPKALAIKVYGGRLGNAPAPSTDGWDFRGDGLPQLTGRANFDKFGVQPGMDLKTSVRVMFSGMLGGLYTGAKLADYFDLLPGDPVGARKIVNPGDKAHLVAGHYKNFHDAIQAASELTPQPADVRPEDARPDDVPAMRSGSLGTVAVSTGAAAATSLIAAIQNPWALAAFALILVAGGVGLWLVLTGRVTILRGKAVV